MKFKSKNKVAPDFNMASMTDLIFLLLIFFMLTSNLVTPSGIPVNLPSSVNTQLPPPAKVHLTISSGLEYFINDRKILAENLESELRNEITEDEKVVVMHIDETVDVKYFVQAAGIASKLGAKLSIATLPEKK